jgi:hypothetical protein
VKVPRRALIEDVAFERARGLLALSHWSPRASPAFDSLGSAAETTNGSLIHGSAKPSAARDVAFVAAQNDGVDEADHAEISCWMRPQRASREISAGRVQLESYQKL